jgi:hypothetical protein
MIEELTSGGGGRGPMFTRAVVGAVGATCLLGVAACSEEEVRGEFTFVPAVVPSLEDAPADLGGLGSVAVRSDASLLAVTEPGMNVSRVFLFDGDGAFVTALGSPGEGPSEYGGISAVTFDRADSLWVFDSNNARADVYDPALALARSLPLNGRVRRAQAAVDGGILASILVEEGANGLAMQVIHLRGEEHDLVARDRIEDPFEESLLAQAGDHLFLAHRRQYLLRRLGSDGALDTIANTPPGWWTPAEASDEVAALMDIAPNLLALAARAPDEVWLAAAVVDPPRNAEAILSGDARDLAREVSGWIRNVVQVLDPSTGIVRGEYHFDGAPVYFLDEEWGYRLEPTGPNDLVNTRLVIGRYGVSVPAGAVTSARDPGAFGIRGPNIHPVAGSGVAGRAQLFVQDAVILIAVDLASLTPDHEYEVALHAGRCGEDGPHIRSLQSVRGGLEGSATGRTQFPATEAEIGGLDRDRMVSMQVFSGAGDVIACGEFALPTPQGARPPPE